MTQVEVALPIRAKESCACIKRTTVIKINYFFLKHLSGPESSIDWLIARAPAVLIFPSANGPLRREISLQLRSNEHMKVLLLKQILSTGLLLLAQKVRG